MYNAIVYDRDTGKVKQYLEEGLALAKFYTNQDGTKAGLNQNIAARNWAHRYFRYQQPDGTSKNLIQVLLPHQRSYFHDNKESDYFKVCEIFISFGVDIDTVDANGNSMAHHVAEKPRNKDSEAFFALLLKRKANMGVANHHGDTPAHLAVSSNKSSKFIYSIVLAGGNLHSLNNFNLTPLDYASKETKNKIRLYPILLKKTCMPASK